MASGIYASTRTRKATHCRQCGKPRTPARQLSSRALCFDCSEANQRVTAEQLVAKSGDHYNQWVESMAQAIERARRYAG